MQPALAAGRVFPNSPREFGKGAILSAKSKAAGHGLESCRQSDLGPGDLRTRRWRQIHRERRSAIAFAAHVAWRRRRLCGHRVSCSGVPTGGNARGAAGPVEKGIGGRGAGVDRGRSGIRARRHGRCEAVAQFRRGRSAAGDSRHQRGVAHPGCRTTAHRSCGDRDLDGHYLGSAASRARCGSLTASLAVQGGARPPPRFRTSPRISGDSGRRRQERCQRQGARFHGPANSIHG